jgi:PAB1-binding protein PBP1
LAGLEDFEDGCGTFDQFKGKRSTYDENLYTTKIDSAKVTPDIERLAEQKEREILNAQSNGNVHLAEERGQKLQKDTDETNRYDEEMKFSGVYRNNKS